MKRLTIPAILAATVLVAGMFAFMPVEQASTVHDTITSTLAGANLLRITTTIGDGADNLYSGTITFDRTTGTGAFQIRGLFMCDVEMGTDAGDNILQTFAIFGGDLITGVGGGLRNNNLQETLLANECADISYDTDGEVHSLFLGGDENNDLVITLVETDINAQDDGDGATVVAYVIGLDAATDLTITSTTADT